MLIGGDNVSNEAITLGTCFSMFVYNRALHYTLRYVRKGNVKAWAPSTRIRIFLKPHAF